MTALQAEDKVERRKREIEINYGGEKKEFPFHPAETVLQLIEHAIRKFHLTSQPHQLGLYLNGALLDPGKTLKEAGVKPGACLVLQQTVVQGG
jgi:hypothetical protein